MAIILTVEARALHEANRIAWNQGAAAYELEVDERIAFLQTGGANFVACELPYLSGLQDWCRRAIHLQCAGGTDTLSLWNLGAREVVGIDISDRMIEVARHKSRVLGAPARWYRCDVLEAPRELDSTADLVYTGRGAVCWIHDLDRWAAVIYRLLKPGGRVYVFEGHPIACLMDATKSDFALDPLFGDYFADQVLTEGGWPDTYIGDLGMRPEEHAEKHERNWRLGQIVTALAEAGLRLVKLEEHPDPFWNANPNMPEEVMRRLPQTFSLLMVRER